LLSDKKNHDLKFKASPPCFW